MSSYCMYCGGTGVMVNGDVCTHCKVALELEEDVDLTYLEIPMAYRGAQFNQGLIPLSMPDAYGSYLSSLYKEITSMKPMCKNVFISSPPQTGKTVFVYSCMEFLFRKRYTVFPYFDLNEIECIMRDSDKGRKCGFLNEETSPFDLYESEILFVKVPEKIEFSTGETLATLIDRRVRRSKTTIIMSTKSWTDVVNADKSNTLKNMTGDGSFKSILVKNFWRNN